MCKRYFFILFVLKICTFRFANYTLRVSVFFHGKPCRRPPKNKLEEAQEIRMPTRVGHV